MTLSTGLCRMLCAQEGQVLEVSSTGSMSHTSDLAKCHSAALPDCLRLSCIVFDAARHAKAADRYAWYTVGSCGGSVSQWELQLHVLSRMHRLEV